MPLRCIEVVPGVHRLFNRYENWYLIEAGGRLTVLDAGLPAHWAEFCSALSQLGRTLADIDAVLITHHHPDHAGNAERLRASGARVLCHPADAPYLRGERQVSRTATLPYLRRPWYAVYMLHLLLNRVTRVPPVAELNEMSDGETLDVPGSPRVIHAPGHTAGSCALFIEDRSLLFTGDTLVTLDMTRGRTGPRVIRGPVTENAEEASESLALLAATNAEIVLPGHGQPWLDGIGTAVDIARVRS